MTASFTNNAGWTFDLAAKTMVWPGVDDTVRPLPDASIVSGFWFGSSYWASQAASRTVADTFRKEWANEVEGRKVKDAPKSCVPASDSDAYVAALLEARKALWEKIAEGYEVGMREGGASVFEEELDRLARGWLQTFATAKGWYTLPPKKKVARDDDAYTDPKGRYSNFGEALAAFVASSSDSKFFALTVDNRPWPIKTKVGVSLADLLVAEARKRADAREAAKPQAAQLGDAADDADF